jgi:hypothetical protein
LEKRLAGYLTAAGALGTVMATDAEAIIVFNQTPQPISIDGGVPIDFNSDGQVDYEIDHDRIDVGGGNIVDFLQIDKNDTNGGSPGENPCPINVFDTFDPMGTHLNNTADAGYVTPTDNQGDYPAALSAGTLIGPASPIHFQEGDNFQGTGRTIRANRLIDEDAGQCDQSICGLSALQVEVPTNGPNFIGLGGETRYLGVRMHLADDPGSNSNVTYGWIGIRITNDADATGEVVGWAYETSGGSIRAGQIPEPSSIVMTALGSAALLGTALVRWLRRK